MKKKIYIIALLGLIIDQLSKLIVTNFMDIYHSITVVEDFFFLTYIRNKGAAWGIFSNNTLILALISLVFLFFLIKYINNETEIKKINAISFGFILGGIAGNLLDRLIRGYVVDFFRFVILGYNYPVFNIADVLIVIGVILFIVDLILGDGRVVKRK